MANMSYCRFQNTLPDLSDCLEALDDGVLDRDDGLSEEEMRAAKKLIAMCVRIAQDYGDSQP